MSCRIDPPSILLNSNDRILSIYTLLVIELYEYAYFIFRLVVSILVSLLTLAYGFISQLLPGK